MVIANLGQNPRPEFDAEAQESPALPDLVRVLQMVFLRKTEDCTPGAAEVSDLDPSELGAVRMAGADLAIVLSE